MTFHFDSIFYYVSDLDRSIGFYREIFGFHLLSRDAVARFDIDGVLFELAPLPAGERLPRGGNARLCLRVDNVEAVLRELKEKGVVTRAAEEKSNGVLGAFEDSDGNELCLWQYKQ